MSGFKQTTVFMLVGALAGSIQSPTAGAGTQAHGLARLATVYGDYTDLPTQNDPEFGYSVAMDEGWLAVGAPGVVFNDATHGSNRHGAVFLYYYDNGSWVLDHTILDAAWGDSRCGESVALDYPYLIVGCPGADEVSNPSTEAGIVRWYSHKVQIPSGNHVWSIDSGYHGPPESRCGTAVDIDGPFSDFSQPTLAFGCPGYNDETGLVAVYDRDPGTFDWVLDSYLSASDAAIGSNFGSSISLYRDGDIPFGTENLAVGAPTTTWGVAFGAGTAYVFSSLLGWGEVDLLTHFNPSAYSLTLYGEDVAIRGEDLLIGSPGGFTSNSECSGFSHCGLAEKYVYASGDWSFSADAGIWIGDNDGGNPPGPQLGMKFGQAVAFGFDGMVAISAPRTDGFQTDGGFAEEAGLVEIRAAINPGISLGEIRPVVGGLFGISFGHFGYSLDFGDQYLAVGEPDQGTVFSGPLGAVHIYGVDRIFADGFEFE